MEEFENFDPKVGAKLQKKNVAATLDPQLHNLDDYKQAVCTSCDGKISYITCHVFYEDLAKLAEVLPERTYKEEVVEVQSDEEEIYSPKFASSPKFAPTDSVVVEENDFNLEIDAKKKMRGNGYDIEDLQP